jgi:hypothetical protein
MMIIIMGQELGKEYLCMNRVHRVLIEKNDKYAFSIEN